MLTESVLINRLIDVVEVQILILGLVLGVDRFVCRGKLGEVDCS